MNSFDVPFVLTSTVLTSVCITTARAEAKLKREELEDSILRLRSAWNEGDKCCLIISAQVVRRHRAFEVSSIFSIMSLMAWMSCFELLVQIYARRR